MFSKVIKYLLGLPVEDDEMREIPGQQKCKFKPCPGIVEQYVPKLLHCNTCGRRQYEPEDYFKN
jgi:hypothetical protein